MDNNYVYDLSNGKQIVAEAPDVLRADESYYNCGGFALGTFNWYLPYDEDDRGDINELTHEYCDLEDYGTPYDYAALCDLIADIYVNHMVSDLGVREVDNVNDCRADEHIVAFRASTYDFHYIRRLKDGTWAQKMGDTQISTWTDEEVFASEWECYHLYAGEVRLLAVLNVGLDGAGSNYNCDDDDEDCEWYDEAC